MIQLEKTSRNRGYQRFSILINEEINLNFSVSGAKRRRATFLSCAIRFRCNVKQQLSESSHPTMVWSGGEKIPPHDLSTNNKTSDVLVSFFT